jgi:hypothetical protein
MRKALLTISFFLLVILNASYAQTDRFAYVITDVNKDGIGWSSLRKIDLQNNTYSDVLFQGNDVNRLPFDAASKKQFTAPLNDTRFGILANAAFGTGVAAIAYDKRNQRLYYTPMLFDQLRYIDLRTMKVYFVGGTEQEALKVKAPDQSNIITRMAIAADGNGYALTNDGTHLLRFNTNRDTKLTDMGTLVDAAENKGISVHNSCSSFGGDMIADDEDNLYVFSARNHVFKIDIATKVATHLGAVTGLPENFTINGAAVGEDNKILIASATNNNALYTVDHTTLAATIVKSDVPWRSSDLANSNLLTTRKSSFIDNVIKSPEEISDNRLSIYPNPVFDNKFTLQFNRPKGKYTILITDVLGRQAFQSVVNVQGLGQVESLQLPPATKQGVYLVKVVDGENKSIFSKKIVVQ